MINALACPWALLLFAPWGFCLWRTMRRCRRPAALPFPALRELPRTDTWRRRAAALPAPLLLAAAALAIVALARPQRQSLANPHSAREAIAIEMAIDISGSMCALDLATDAAPRKTRLDVVKETFRDFVERRPDDLVGLVAFGGFATTRAPLTFDHEALFRVLEATSIPGEDGTPATGEETMTAIGDGLALACARLRAASNVASRVAVLLSDGENNAGVATPGEAAEMAAADGVRVYTIGVGRNTRGNVPGLARTPDGRTQMVWVDARLDDRVLRAIASKTGGRYFAVGSRNALDEALAEIDSLEKTSLEEAPRRRADERFAPLLAGSLALTALALCLAPLSRKTLV